MSTLLRPDQVTTVASLGKVLVKHSRAGLFDVVDGGGPDEDDPRPEALADELEAMGPAWIKLGQILSERADLVSAPYRKALRRLRGAVEPFPGEVAREVIEEDLGIRISKAFSEFEDEPLAAASLAQVHRARLRDGSPVVVKVQRPEAQESVERDLELLGQVAGLLEDHTGTGGRIGARDVFAEIDVALRGELDFRSEARNLEDLHRGLVEFERLIVPCPVMDFTARRVLTMDLIEGTTIEALSPVALVELDTRDLLTELFSAYLHLALGSGLVHCDPHPGNLMITPEGRLAVIDAGMVLRIPEHLRDPLLRLLVAVSTGEGREAALVLESVSRRTEDYDRERMVDEVARLVARQHADSSGDRAIGRAVMSTVRAAIECGLRVPREATLLGKTLLDLDEVSCLLDPDFAPDRVVRKESMSLVQRRSLATADPGSVLRAFMEAKGFVAELPRRVERSLDRFADGDFEVTLRIPDDSPVMTGAQKMANRIASGIIIAGLIVGAALLMSVPTDFTILGYPGLAIVFFLGAAIGGAALLARIWSDI